MNQENRSLLEMRGILKTFPPVTALKEVTLRVRPGSIHALCGENGAGKSTLMKILSGVYQPDGGTILWEGKPRTFATPAEALDAGISMLYQELELAGDLTVVENIFLGREIISHPLLHTIDLAEETRRVQALMEEYGFTLSSEAPLKTLSPGECQIVELLKALMRKAKLIVMDEPTSSLSEAETEKLFHIIRDLRSRGIAIIYISHRMNEVKQLADEISVLRDGMVVASAPAEEQEIPQIIRHMVGRQLNDYYPARHAAIGETLFEAKGVSAANGISGISFSVRAGEIVGMAGLVGAGRSETARAIFGIDEITAGKCFLEGKELHIRTPKEAIRAGIGLLTEDRKRTGLCTALPCSWNVTLPNYETIGMKYLLSLSKETALTEKFGRKVKAKWSSPDSPADSLSGGNQQKLLLARWLMAKSKFLIFDEPTRGIDVGAKKEIYQLLNELAEEGRAILVISSELPELFGICDRLLVMRDGKIAGERVTARTTPEEIMHLAAVSDEEK